MRRRIWIAAVPLLLLTIFFIYKHSSGSIGETSDTSPQASLWSEYVSLHTPEVVSRDTTVRIRFVNDIIDSDKAGTSASDVFSIEPAVEGEILFSDAREIVLRPKGYLKSGQKYRVKVKTSKLKGFPDNLTAYIFDFRVKKQDFEVNISGLDIDPDNEKQYALNGDVITADLAEPAAIEKMIEARQEGKSLDIKWRHEDPRTHHFSLRGIVKQDKPTKVTLKWEGGPIDVDNDGKREIEVPAIGVFTVTGMQAVQGNDQSILINFSERLDTTQNLNGLIRLTQDKFTSRIEGNTIKLFPERGLVGKVTVTVEKGVKSTAGGKLAERVVNDVTFTSQPPQVRFAGSGVILPENDTLTIPIETINVNSVQVTAFQVFDNNIGQFLQSNTKLDGTQELHRVGRFLWRKTIALKSPDADKWNRYNLDVGELLRSHPGSLFRLTLSINRGNSTYTCNDASRNVPVVKEEPFVNHDDMYLKEQSYWDDAEEYNDSENQPQWTDRNDPCKDSYYRYASNVSQSRNFMASNIGLIAKRGSDNKLRIVTTDLRTAAPLGDVKIRIMNFQNQEIGRVTSDPSGFSNYQLKETPFYLAADKGRQRGYLRINDSSALPVSHFDVGGEKITKGIKGTIYGERGVWRPGDPIYLTFVLQDRQKIIPDNHPVTMELYNPRGQLVQTLTNTTPINGFYTFKMKTDDDAPTGNWTAKALLGGTTFTKSLKIETVMPNRLKIELKFGKQELLASDGEISGKLFAQWLHGAKASGLKADVSVLLSRKPTHFTRFSDYVFDDPTRDFRAEAQKLFEGTLDSEGYANLSGEIAVERDNAPGMLSAGFTTRVFENGGAFSIASDTVTFHPFDHYVGIKLPKGDATRHMLLTDKDHAVGVATLDAEGNPVSVKEVQLTLYKIDWKWWWDKSGDSLANFSSGSYNNKIAEGTISTSKDGRGVWHFQVKYPDWGRYLVRACDLDGGHCTGQVVYIDWPGWAGRSAENNGVGANMLTIFADKNAYAVGDTATIQLPAATRGRALMSIENGATVIEQRWLDLGKDNTRIRLPITASMSPNVYVSVTVVQPHKDRDNDRPIRLYGIVPINVTDLSTHLTPRVNTTDEWRPNSTVDVEVSEDKGRAMTYTLAIVDEGLLGLTSFKTPNLHDYFFKKEALGVNTWDMYDDVAGAYSGELERLLSLGGSDEESTDNRQNERKRFPPVVRFMGPFKLKPGEHAKHSINIPQYIGAVRVMVVAGGNGAYGSAEKSVPVRAPLSMLVTLPRVLTPDEELDVPVSLFALDAKIKEATLKIAADEHFAVTNGTARISFKEPGEMIGFLKLKVKPKLGKAHLRFTAEGGGHTTSSDIYIDVVSPNPKSTHLWNIVLDPGKSWNEQIVPHGLAGTNRITLEISTLMPLNMDGRLHYLIQYPHGCIEQTTSSVFPQVALPSVMKLDPETRKKIDNNILAGIDRLRSFQNSDGGFSYWPGDGHSNDWGTTYAGHFLVEAGKQGYAVPPQMLNNMITYEQQHARSYTSGTLTQLDQAYRLYVLALAGKPETGAMNRLRESGHLDSTTRWQLAAAYQLAGMPDAASELVQNDNFAISRYNGEGPTFGSELRDRAIMLNSLVLTGRSAKAKEFADIIAKELASEKWYSTQSVAYSLIAIARFAGGTVGSEPYTFSYTVGNGDAMSVTADTPMVQQELSNFPDKGSRIAVKNTSNRKIFGTLIAEGVSRAGEEQAQSNGLRLETNYTDLGGNPVNVAELKQGSDLVAHIKVTNTSDRELTNLALTHIVPSGWEIHNPRMAAGTAESLTPIDYQDVRDDRIFTYFGLKSGESKTFKVQFNAAYRGRFYQPGLSVGAMYDATVNASTLGQWVEVMNKDND